MTRLHDAISKLTDPGSEAVLRDRPSIRARRAELDDAHRDHIAYLRARHAAARATATATGSDSVRARSAAGMRRALTAMTTAGERHRARRAALTAADAAIPSVLEQLFDAVLSTAGGGNGSRGVHRSPLNAAAVELLTTIDRTIGTGPLPQLANDTLEHRLWVWDPDDHDAAAELVNEWVADAAAILDPPRSLEGTGACPVCGERWVWAEEGDERIRRAAIRMVITSDKANDFAECLNRSCAARWPRTHWDLLAAALRTS